jgi:hypothetical protein
MSLYKDLANSHPKLQQGFVHCKSCGRVEKVDSAECLRSGWPECCGYTMTLGLAGDSPKEEGK